MKTAEQWRTEYGHLKTMPVHPQFFTQGVIEKIQKDATTAAVAELLTALERLIESQSGTAITAMHARDNAIAICKKYKTP